jgi:sugar phosphate isomerase/epimerase
VPSHSPSICEFTTYPATFERDVAAYAAAGAGGIGICEAKVSDWRDVRQRLRASGLAATHCIPAVSSILAREGSGPPTEPEKRVEAICASVRRFAEVEPASVVFLTGPRGERDAAEVRRIVVEGIAAIGEVAERTGVPVAIEPIHRSGSTHSFIHAIPEALALVADAGAEKSVGVLLDTWHLGDDRELEQHIRECGRRIVGVHLADRRKRTRTFYDRALPGDGVLELGALLCALVDAGYDGWYDVEVFSDNGVLGTRLPDSLWELPAEEVARRACAAFARLWA